MFFKKEQMADHNVKTKSESEENKNASISFEISKHFLESIKTIS